MYSILFCTQFQSGCVLNFIGFNAMSLGLLFLQSVSSGVITSDEMKWITAHQREFSRIEEATALKLGRLLDRGSIQLGCRITD